MKQRRKITLTGVSILLVALLAFAANEYLFGGHRDIAEEKAALRIETAALMQKVQASVSEEQALADSVIEISGGISEIEDGNTIILDGSVQVALDPERELPQLSEGAMVVMKGRYVGYDDLLEMVKVDQAILLITN